MIIEFIILNLGILLGTAWWLSKKQSDSNRPIFWTSLLVKLLAGICVGVIYFYYYGKGDTQIYWRDGVLLSNKIMASPIDGIRFFWDGNSNSDFIEGILTWDSRSIFFVKICSVLAILSGGSYWVMALQLSFISFLATWYLFTRIILFFPSARTAGAISFLFYPSVVFWSSGLIKESLGLASIFFLAGSLLMFVKNQKIHLWEWFTIILSLWIGWNLKYYWMGIFIPIALSTLVVIKLKEKSLFVRRFELTSWCALLIVILLIGTNVHPNFYPDRFLGVIVENNKVFTRLSDPDNIIHYDNLSPTVASFLKNVPQALVSGLFRPFFWEGGNIMAIAAGIENLIFLLLIGISLPSLARAFRSPDRLFGIAVITYSVVLVIFLAMSTPNLGTLSRYKIGFLPFLVFLILCKSPLINRLKQFRG